MISKITKRIFLATACIATYNAQGALMPQAGEQETGRQFLHGAGGLIIAAGIATFNQKRIKGTISSLLAPAQIPEGAYTSEGFVHNGRRVLRRKSLSTDLVCDVRDGGQALAGVLALKIALNSFQGNPLRQGLSPFMYTALAAATGYSTLKYLPRLLTPYVTNAETYSFGGLALFTLVHLGVKSALNARGKATLNL